eukprot:4368880-Pleurochrysis_carterae.AAC.1
MDNKINDRERDERTTTGQRDAHLLVNVSQAPSLMDKNFNTTSTPTSGRGIGCEQSFWAFHSR